LIRDKNNLEIIKSLIQKHNLVKFQEFILENSIDTITFEIEEIKDESKYQKGISKFGEPPHFPKSVNWPYDKKLEEYKPFVGQINLEEVKKFDINNLLPKTGIIYLFFSEGLNALEYYDYPLISQLELIKDPPEYSSMYVDEDLKPLNKSWKINFSLGVNVPNSFQIENKETDDYENYDNFIKELYKIKLFKLGHILDCQNLRDKNLMNEVNQLLPLIEIPNFNEFGDGWDLEHRSNAIFWIKEKDLENKNFNNAWNDYSENEYPELIFSDEI
jgi:uncharacterized protein YwqG